MTEKVGEPTRWSVQLMTARCAFALIQQGEVIEEGLKHIDPWPHPARALPDNSAPRQRPCSGN